MTEVAQAENPPQTNGVDGYEEDERTKNRPADIHADVKEMERRKRVEHIMNSKMFREELERIIETQMSEGTGTNSLMQQISDIMGVNKQAGNVYKNSSCVLPINDIRGVEAIGYDKGEKILRCKLAAVYRLIDLYGWNQGSSSLITARLNQDEEHFLVNPYGMLFHEITASSLIKVDMQANIVEQGTTNFAVNISAFSLHGAVHAARPDIKCIIHIHNPSVVAISALKAGILPISQESVVIGEVSVHSFYGGVIEPEEKDKLARNLGPINKVLLLNNLGALCCGQTIEEALYNARNTVLACESQLKLLPVGLDNIIVLNEEERKKIYEAAHKEPESTPRPDKPSILESKVERKWRVGGVEFEGLMRMLDNVGFRTGYIYRHPLVKGDIPKPKNDVEVPPAVSSLGYLLEEEELYKKGLWRNLGEGKKGQNRSRWLNSPNVYQKVELLETGTQDPKKITKWVADGSPTHSSTPVRIDNALQFVPVNTNPKEFKLKQQQIKDYRRADKISAGPQSYILDTLTWEEARKMQDASVTQTGDQVVLMGAASKGIIQRGHQHNAMVYKSPYAKNPFDSVTDEELDEYKKVVEKKTKSDYDTDFSESELSSANINKRIDNLHLRSPTSETEEESRDEPQVLRIQTAQAPKPSQPEVVLSDGHAVFDFDARNYAYRNNSHFGLPKGSYLNPNPVHFHIVRKTEIARLKPVLTYYHPRKIVRSSNNATCVNINLDSSRSLSVNLNADIVKSFIGPFAEALNLYRLPNLCPQECQTSYMTNFYKKPIDYQEIDRNHTPLIESDLVRTTFEEKILNDMQNKLMDISIDDDDVDNELEPLRNFDENDMFIPNESMNEMNDNLVKNGKIADEFDYNANLNVTFEVNDIFDVEDDVSQKNDFNLKNNPGNNCEQNENLFNGVDNTDFNLNVTFNKNELRDDKDEEPVKLVKNLCENSCNCNVMEQSNDLNDSFRNTENSPDPKVIRLSRVLYEYLTQQCFQIKPILSFPDVINNPNINKLLARLKETYLKFYVNPLSVTDKSELRILITKEIMNLLAPKGFVITNGLDSHQLFTISEFVSNLLDIFFKSVSDSSAVILRKEESGSFLEFSQALDDVLHSTDKSNTQGEVQILSPISVTSFKKNKSRKSGVETYWMSCNQIFESPALPKKPIINIDDIPLRPPEDLVDIIYEGNYCGIGIAKFDEEICKEDAEECLFAGGDNNLMKKSGNLINCVVNEEKSNEEVYSSVKSDETFYSVNTSVLSDEGNWMGFENAKF